MTTVSPTPPKPDHKSFDPDDFRMTIGEHLEDLRKRLIYGLVGLAVAVIFFFIPAIGERVVMMFCAPLIRGMQAHQLTPQLHVIGLTEGFMTYLQVCIICAIVLAGPWLLYQMWLFIAAGLYAKERKTVTRYIPLSIILLASGVLFVYFIVLPLTVDFFLTFNGSLPLPPGYTDHQLVQKADLPVRFPTIDGDPATAPDGAVWFNALEDRLKIKVHGKLRIMQFSAENLIASTFTLDEYIGFVLTFMLVFGLAFQLPLVLLALVRVGIVEIDFLRKQRRLVYFIMAIVAAVIAPGDVVTSMLALLIPLLLLYEFGIWLAQWGQNKRDKESEAALRE
jgi:sec-independent protein translocase protein TatC